MGLDMYLNAKKQYLSETISFQIAQILKQHGDEIGDAEILEVTIKHAYWRKSNHIHKWFVDNVQKGNDDCGTYWVNRSKLQELLELCQRVLNFKHLAEDQLPTQSGFFFGSTDYDESYYNDIVYTIHILEQALSMPDSWNFEYSSSW